MAIDVFFTGLMLICLDGGQATCFHEIGENTAWVVKADGTAQDPDIVCGRPSTENTTLQATFYEDDFSYKPPAPPVTCQNPGGDKPVICTFPTDQLTEITLVPDMDDSASNFQDGGKLLPRLTELDQRILMPNLVFFGLTSLVPTGINFKGGNIVPGDPWTSDGYKVYWYRSNNYGAISSQRELTDRLKVTYSKASVMSFAARGVTLLTLTQKQHNSRGILVRNYATSLKSFSYENGGKSYDELDYLVWYYRVSAWGPFNFLCPDYNHNSLNSVAVLRCDNSDKQKHCACSKTDPQNGVCLAETVHWPPVLN